MKKIPFDEQETTISVYPKQVSETAEIYTCIPHTVRRIKQLASNRPEDVRIEKDTDDGLFAVVPSGWIRISPPRRSAPMSEEQRQNLAARLEKNIGRRKET